MSVTLTAAGEALIARLQAEGTPLVIDRFIFADVPGQDHTQPASPAQGVPTANVVHEFPIPPEYRAFVAPNQVVYSALLGSDVGPFSFNWQGLYCTEHATLVAVATFPRLEKRRYDPATNTQGNNLTRNFLLEFSGARELTQITVEAAVWQLDFTVRLKGIDERERLSNRDIYGRAAFLDDGWLLTHTGGAYRFEAGRGYVEGIRAALQDPTPVVPTVTPCEVWLDVSMQGQGSDVVTVVTPLCLAIGTDSPDYVAAAPHNTPHYCEKVARIEADGSVTDLRPRRIGIAPEQMGAVTHEELEAALLRVSGLPIGMPFLFPGTTPPAGCLSIVDGPLLLREAYPQLWGVAQASGNIITEAAWQAKAAVQSSVGEFSSGDGATTFRCPRWRDFARAAYPAGGRALGQYDADENKSHSHLTGVPYPTSARTFYGAKPTGNTKSNYITDQTGSITDTPETNAVGGTEARPKSVNWLPCIKAYDAVVNTGELDWAALATTLAGKVDRSDWVTLVPGAAYRLPNGLIVQWGQGTASSSTGGVATSPNTVLPVAFSNTNYCVLPVSGPTADHTSHVVIASKTTTGFVAENANNYTQPFSFFAIGL